ncbi:cytochrome c3 family protein [Ferrimonas senticii]|uniref:cytochrome c3 family protein n=1 Tax=Ferrimonas senticii TaxID=394566 RepID=UPI00042260A7|nr:cytochrome c3 family protein [Ferrimonas senticii]
MAALVLLLSPLAIAQTGTVYPQPISQQTPSLDSPCLPCHQAETTIIPLSAGAHAGILTAPLGSGCQSCHGKLGHHGVDADATMIAFGADSPLPAASKNSVCLSCHQDMPHMGWNESTHNRVNLACTDCHAIHNSGNNVLDPQAEVKTCTHCHSRKGDNLSHRRQQSFSGAVCTSCHNPHGTPIDLLF